MAATPLYFQPMKESLLAISAASPLHIWGIDELSNIVSRAVDGSWHKQPALPGTDVGSISCGADGTVMAVGRNRKLYRYVPEQNVPPLADGNPWREVTGISDVAAVSVGSCQWIAVVITTSGASSVELYLGEGKTVAAKGNPALFGSPGRCYMDAEGHIHAIGENTKELWTTTGSMVQWPFTASWFQLDISFEHDLLNVCSGGNNTRFLLHQNELHQLLANTYTEQVQPMLRTWNDTTKKWDFSPLNGPYGWISGFASNRLWLQTSPEEGVFKMYETLPIQNPEHWAPPS